MKHLGLILCTLLAFACGSDGNNGSSNNGASNNGAMNNGASNNGASNNGNNGAVTDCDIVCGAGKDDVACIQTEFGTLGFALDDTSCTDFTDSVSFGINPDGACALFDQCGLDQGYSEAECTTVRTACNLN